MKGFYKVPFRQVYCGTLRSWLAQVIECHVVLKIDPPKFSPIMQETVLELKSSGVATVAKSGVKPARVLKERNDGL